MTPRDTFGVALRNALAHRGQHHRKFPFRSQAATDLEFVQAVMDAADVYRDAAVALAAEETCLRAASQEVGERGRGR